MDWPYSRYTIAIDISRQLGSPFGTAEFGAGRGSILVLSPKETKGKILRFIAQRGEGVIGASVEVADLASCRQILEKSGLWPAAFTGNLRG